MHSTHSICTEQTDHKLNILTCTEPTKALNTQRVSAPAAYSLSPAGVHPHVLHHHRDGVGVPLPQHPKIHLSWQQLETPRGGR
uniref:Uncharacterized protein n=1 Tax=Anguilla anguilla TaxID=7936 RepID=A0A0E9R1G0_ANGAN